MFGGGSCAPQGHLVGSAAKRETTEQFGGGDKGGNITVKIHILL
jgi:hypothetical protein